MLLIVQLSPLRRCRVKIFQVCPTLIRTRTKAWFPKNRNLPGHRVQGKGSTLRLYHLRYLPLQVTWLSPLLIVARQSLLAEEAGHHQECHLVRLTLLGLLHRQVLPRPVLSLVLGLPAASFCINMMHRRLVGYRWLEAPFQLRKRLLHPQKGKS